MRFFRVRLDQVATDDPSPIVLTVPLNETKQIAQIMPHAGWWGIPKSNHWCRPLVFRPDGIVDFGGDPEDNEDERLAEMQIFGRSFELGESFYLKDLEDGEVSQFVVRDLIDLAEIK